MIKFSVIKGLKSCTNLFCDQIGKSASQFNFVIDFDHKIIYFIFSKKDCDQIFNRKFGFFWRKFKF
jgi:hypothetical protein